MLSVTDRQKPEGQLHELPLIFKVLIAQLQSFEHYLAAYNINSYLQIEDRELTTWGGLFFTTLFNNNSAEGNKALHV